MSSLSVYTFQSPRRFLVEFFNQRQQRQSDFSVRQWAKEMDVSHTLLLMLMQGKRPLRLKHAPVLAKGLSLSSAERLYFQALIEFDSATTVEQKNLIQVWLTEMHPGGARKNLELETFNLISDWIHFGIISLCSPCAIENHPVKIARRFGPKVSASRVRTAIERLIEMGLVSLDDQGRILATHQNYSSRNDVSDRGVKEYHRQIADLSKSAVLEQEPAIREFQGFSLPLNPKKMELAKELIRRFRDQFCEAMEIPPESMGSESSADYDVYQMNLHFFRLTERPLEKSRTADEGVGLIPLEADASVPPGV